MLLRLINCHFLIDINNNYVQAQQCCVFVCAVVRVDQIDRYKYVAVVHIGPTESTQIIIASRCLLKADFDTFASHSFNNQRLFAVATVYAFYRE